MEEKLNLQKLLDDFKSELEKQFNDIFNDKNIEKNIISTQIENFRKRTFANINKELDKIAQEKGKSSELAIKKLLNQNKEKYINEFNITLQSFLKATEKEQNQFKKNIDDISINEQNIINKEIENIKNIQNKALKQIENKKLVIENKSTRGISTKSLNMARSLGVDSTSDNAPMSTDVTATTSANKKNINNNNLIKSFKNLLDSFEVKLQKRKESKKVQQTINSVTEKQKNDSSIKTIDVDKQKEIQEESKAEQFEADLAQVESESDDVTSDMKLDHEKLKNEQKQTEDKKKKYDFTSEQGWVSWLADVSVDVLKWGSLAIAAGGISFWDWITGEGKKVEEQTNSIDAEGNSVIDSVEKENEQILIAENDSIKEPDESDSIKELPKISNDVDKIIADEKKINPENIINESATLETKSIDNNITTLNDQMKQETEQGESSPTGGASMPKLPSLGLAGAPQPAEKNVLQEESENVAKDITKDSLLKQTSIQESSVVVETNLDKGQKENEKLTSANVIEPSLDSQKIKLSPITENIKPTSASTNKENSLQNIIDEEKFNIDDIIGTSKINNVQASQVVDDSATLMSQQQGVMSPSRQPKEVFLQAKEVKLSSASESTINGKKDGSNLIKQPLNLIKDNIKSQSTIVMENKLEKVNKEIKYVEQIKQSVKPMENKSTIINEQTYMMDDFYNLLEEVTDTLNALSKALEVQKGK